MHKAHIKVLLVVRYQGWTSRSVLSLIKIAHQLWTDYTFSQRDKTTERTVGVEVGGDRGWRGGGWTEFEKVGVGYTRGVFIK